MFRRPVFEVRLSRSSMVVHDPTTEMAKPITTNQPTTCCWSLVETGSIDEAGSTRVGVDSAKTDGARTSRSMSSRKGASVFGRRRRLETQIVAVIALVLVILCRRPHKDF